MLALSVACAAAAAVWAYLVLGHGGYWRTGQRLPPSRAAAAPTGGRTWWPGGRTWWPSSRPAMRPRCCPPCCPTLLGQDYPGALTVILVDDCSSDGTAEVAAASGRSRAARGGPCGWWRAPRRRPAGPARCGPWPRAWRGRLTPAHDPAGAGDDGARGYVLFTDADIAWRAGALRALVRAAEADDRDLVSQMALLRTATAWERVIVPAFVYFFAQLYPFRRVNSPRSRTAAAAGGCMLVRREALERSGGLAPIRGARIDDVALGRVIKRQRGRCWLGLSTAVVSVRPYPAARRPVADGGPVRLHPAQLLSLAAGRDHRRAGLHLPAAARPGPSSGWPGAGRPATAPGRARGRRGPGGLGPDVADLPAHAAAVPALAAAGARPAADRPAVRRDDGGLGAAALRRPRRGVEGPDGPGPVTLAAWQTHLEQATAVGRRPGGRLAPLSHRRRLHRHPAGGKPARRVPRRARPGR